MDEVFMDVEAVKRIASTFETVSGVLQGVSLAMQILSISLKANVFVGVVGGFAAAQFIDRIQPQVKRMAEKCADLSKDVTAAKEAYQRGDQQGSLRFY